MLAFRLSVGAVKMGQGFVRFGVPDMGDVISFPDGRVLWTEGKAPKGRQTADQLSGRFCREQRPNGFSNLRIARFGVDEYSLKAELY